uniref:Vascular endothelial growth factor receptor 1-like isoform X2 n=1 Tax=Crassostrea virginica TaxID=6565 RepID=A0A8B8E1K3_CRAVI|nr:vascular endothelial growth factor receptor 1-like isoform X2 [Crassostrea virginica]
MDGLQFINGVVFLVLLLSSLLAKAQFRGFHGSLNRHPTFNPTRHNVTYYVGETALLECSVENLGTKEIIWKNRNQKHVITVGSFVFVGNGAYSVSHPDNSPHYDLVIKNVQKHHAGVYECQVSTREEMSINIQLNVIDPPKDKEISSVFSLITASAAVSRPAMTLSGAEFVDQGEAIRLSCNATGVRHAPEDVDWFFKGHKIQSSVQEEIIITKFHSSETRTLLSTLEIERSKMEHSGIYICRSTDLTIKSHNVQVINASKNSERAVKDVGGTSEDRTGRQAEQKDNHCSLLTTHFPTLVLLSTLSSLLIYLPR